MDKLQEITETNDIRNVLWERVNGGIAAGLPVPWTLTVAPDLFDMRLANDDMQAAEAWAKHLGFSAPALGGRYLAPDRWYRAYKTNSDGWFATALAEIWCAVSDDYFGVRSDADAILAEATR